MKKITQAGLGAVMLGAVFITAQPASADSITLGFSFGAPDVGEVFGDPCYGPVPCSYPVYYEPVFIDGAWYRGPIYYRWSHGRRLFWYHGGWRHDEWRGRRPHNIEWRDWHQHRGWNDGWRGDREWHARHEDRGNSWHRDHYRHDEGKKDHRRHDRD